MCRREKEVVASRNNHPMNETTTSWDNSTTIVWVVVVMKLIIFCFYVRKLRNYIDWRGPGLGPPLTVRLSPLKRQDIPTPLTMCEGQDRQRQDKDSGKGGEKTLVKTHTGKTSSLWPVGCISDQFPTRGPLTRSLHLAREVSASHDKSVSEWRVGPDTRHKHRHRRVWGNESPRHAGTAAGGPPRQEP
jgi:hypothetical protein